MADEYLNKAGAQVLAGKIKENAQYGETLTAILAKDHATSLRVYATLSDRPSAIDVANGVLLAVGERCFVVATGKYYKVTAVDNETNAITWEETDALFGDGGGTVTWSIDRINSSTIASFLPSLIAGKSVRLLFTAEYTVYKDWASAKVITIPSGCSLYIYDARLMDVGSSSRVYDAVAYYGSIKFTVRITYYSSGTQFNTIFFYPPTTNLVDMRTLTEAQVRRVTEYGGSSCTSGIVLAVGSTNWGETKISPGDIIVVSDDGDIYRHQGYTGYSGGFPAILAVDPKTWAVKQSLKLDQWSSLAEFQEAVDDGLYEDYGLVRTAAVQWGQSGYW